MTRKLETITGRINNLEPKLQTFEKTIRNFELLNIDLTEL